VTSGGRKRGAPAIPVAGAPPSRLLDLFCCEGGASEGYRRAGFTVYGVDLFRHRREGKLIGYRRQRYPFPALQADALDTLDTLLDGNPVTFDNGESLTLADFTVLTASPPCQAYSITKNAHTTAHPELIEPTRDRLLASGLPYVLENVEGAKRQMHSPLMLCGTEFHMRAIDSDGLEVWLRRHRLFESNYLLMGGGGCTHPTDLLCAGVYGNGSPSRDAAKARAGGYTPPSQAVRADLMGIGWMSRNGLSQAIPPVFTEYIGQQLLTMIPTATPERKPA
jgi:DNA (cytosine-5)-methyltransferase 1